MNNNNGRRLPHANRQTVKFYWNGRLVEGRAGDSVAVALLASGVKTLAWTRKSHRPMGYSGSYVTGVLARVNDVPNVRLDLLPVRENLRIEMQNCWPSPQFDLLKLTRLLPSNWVEGGFEHTNMVPSGTRLYQRWEALLAFLAGVAKPAVSRTETLVPQGRRFVVDTLIVGGGPVGCAAANEAVAAGKTALIVSRGERLGRYARARGKALPSLDKRVETLVGIEVFGAYRSGGILLGAPNDPTKGAVVLEAKEVLLATGQRSCPPVVPGMWLPGTMDARAALLMAKDQAVAPGLRVVVTGSGEQTSVAQMLRQLGVNVVAVEPVESLRRVLGHNSVSGALFDRRIDCDSIVYAGPWVSDGSLAFQSGAEGLLQLRDQGTSRFRYIGSAADADQLLPIAPLSRHAALLCPCFDVSTHEVDALLKQGITDLEVIKRLTSCGMGPCQGQPCWDLLRAFVSARTGLPLSQLAKPSQRPPRRAISVSQAVGLEEVVEPLQ
ncbi:2Fe-2S iron-sulfur cluster-binding protein [Pseudomonas sp. RIT-PI-q]|uniref:2Fe-2S iron-sulfur cluster-binding protein n=1 Tax=Pseudomonas sp. RIT-PI-q TaxID=1690247 RepID=UPI0009EA3372|nr:2Fe-2S iron-sulfur cluster-binding protein [Pseudomonas sp. RIT-PI-q]